MTEYQASDRHSSCSQYQAVLSPQRQYDVWGNAQPVYEPVRELQQKVVKCRSADGQLELEFTAKQFSLFPAGVRNCMRGRLTFSRTDKSGTSYFRAQCGTWRCKFCQRWVASVDFARIKAALEKEDPEHLIFVVATIDSHLIRESDKDFNAKKSYSYISQASKMLLQALRRRYGKVKFVASVEKHTQNDYAHINYVFSCKGMAEMFSGEKVVRHINHKSLDHVFKSAGFGRWSAERVRSKAAMAGYVVKIAFENQLTGEVAKKSQLPINAPLRTRRIRTSQKFLPPVQKRKAEEGVTYQFISGISAHELTDARETWDRHFKEWGLEDDCPQEQDDKKEKPEVVRVAPVPMGQSAGTTVETGVVQIRPVLLSLSRISASEDDVEDPTNGPESDVPIGEEVVWFTSYRRKTANGA